MRKTYLLAAAAAAMFAACSSNESIDAGKQPAPVATTPADSVAVGFDAYAGRSATRAGITGDITNDVLKDPAAGFGVFGYYTDSRDYDQLAVPNFMWNQEVTWNAGGYWVYEPVKYWPNEYGNSAISDDNDKVTFFAYAPFVKVNEAGKFVEDASAIATAEAAVTSAQAAYDADQSAANLTALNTAKAALGALRGNVGITGMTRNTVSGDPVIKYVGSFKASEAVDLLWGVYNEENWPLVNGGNSPALDKGLPWLNVERPSQVNQKLKFQFKHALAKLRINVDEFADETKPGSGTEGLKDETRIWIRSVKFTGFSMKGALNLNNETKDKPYWMNYNGIGDLEADAEVIVYDGMKDGKEGTGATASTEKLLGLNPQFIQTEKSFDYTGADPVWATAAKGVTATKTPLFDDGGIFYVIPNPDDDLTVEIVYDVETIDKNLGVRLADNKTAGSSIENRIVKTISFGGVDSSLDYGKAYEINLHLGMNSVKFDADVVDWEELAPADVQLPANVPFFTVNTTGTGNATIPFYLAEFFIGLEGLNGGEATTQTISYAKVYDGTPGTPGTTDWVTAAENNNANASGWVVQKLTISANDTYADREQKVKWTGGTSAKDMTVTFTQQAHPLDLEKPASVAPGTAYTLKGAATNGFFIKGLADSYAAITISNNDDDDPEKGKNGIRIWRNGTLLTGVTTSPTAGQYTFTDAGVITLGEAAVAGDIIKVVLKTGDAAAETISWKVE